MAAPPNNQGTNNPAVLNGGVFGNIIDGRASPDGTRILGTVTVNGAPISGGLGTVTDVTVSTAGGLVATVTNPTTTPNIVLGLGNISPLSVSTTNLTVIGALNASGNSAGYVTLVGGQATVLNSAIDADSAIFFTPMILAGSATTARTYYVSARIPGVSFTVRSTLAGDTSRLGWIKFN